MNERIWVKYAREIGLEGLESIIAPGALATSETLNRFRQSIEEVVQEVAEDSKAYEEKVRLSSSWISAMALWMYGYSNSIYASLNALSSSWKRRFVDMFSRNAWQLSGVMLDTLFGQMTPPISQDTITTNMRNIVYLSVSDSSSTYNIDGGDMALDMTEMLHDQDWTVPLVLPDAGRSYLWLYLPRQQTSLLTNNVRVALLPPGRVYIRRVSVLSGGRWIDAYVNSNTNIFSGRFWWDVRATGNVRAVGIQLHRTSTALPTALVHLSASATRFNEAGTATFNTQTSFGSAFNIRSFTVHPIFPSNPSFSASISGSSNHLFNITVRRITPYVPTVIGGVTLERP